MTCFATLLAALLLSGWEATPDQEIATVALLRGVPPVLALAIADVEARNVPEGLRDAAVSPTHDVGRLQVHCPSPFPPLRGRSRAACIRALKDRHLNIRVGVLVQAYVMARHPGASLREVAARYNDGGEVTDSGWLYADKVEARMRLRLVPEQQRNW